MKQIAKLAFDFLQLMGFELEEKDPLFGMCVRAGVEHVRSQINSQQIPADLTMATVYRIVGEYLQVVLQSGNITPEQMESAVGAVEKQIKQGDTTITLAVKDDLTAQQRFDVLIAHLLNAGNTRYGAFRKVRW